MYSAPMVLSEGARTGTQATDSIISWWTLAASASRSSSRARGARTASPVAMTRSATEREKRACGSSSDVLPRAVRTSSPSRRRRRGR